MYIYNSSQFSFRVMTTNTDGILNMPLKDHPPDEQSLIKVGDKFQSWDGSKIRKDMIEILWSLLKAVFTVERADADKEKI